MAIFFGRWHGKIFEGWGGKKLFSNPKLSPKVIPRKQGKTSANRKREFKKNFLLEIIGNPPLLSNIKFGHKEDVY